MKQMIDLKNKKLRKQINSKFNNIGSVDEYKKLSLALGSLFVASYDSRGYGGGIRTRLHTV
jgi:hypothetical protein